MKACSTPWLASGLRTGNSRTKQDALEADILSLVREFNVSEDGTMVVPSNYLEVVIVRA
ncbi:MAG: hypothetical protein AAFY29_15750 [Pseudomonadota bacterium]